MCDIQQSTGLGLALVMWINTRALCSVGSPDTTQTQLQPIKPLASAVTSGRGERAQAGKSVGGREWPHRLPDPASRTAESDRREEGTSTPRAEQAAEQAVALSQASPGLAIL